MPVIIGATLQEMTPHQVIDKPDVKIVEPRGLDNLPLGVLPIFT